MDSATIFVSPPFLAGVALMILRLIQFMWLTETQVGVGLDSEAAAGKLGAPNRRLGFSLLLCR